MLSNSEIQRYSRQIIIPEIGPTGQSNIKNTSILVIGCGGIGSPCIMYLAAAGTVNLGIIDHDTLDISNLHRQVIHNHNHIGKSKTESASSFIKNLNPNVSCKAYNLLLTADNILDIIKDYDIILDATDNVASRYLINDACVLSKKPLISGSALKLNAQLTTYNYKSGPCYRCINPIPPPPSTIQNCGDAGILGAVVGVVGSMMAIEALKIAMGYDANYSGKLMLYDAFDGSIRVVKLRSRQANCQICGDSPTIAYLADYPLFCSSGYNDGPKTISIIPVEKRISVYDLKELIGNQITLIDVREQVEFDICSIPGSKCIPFRLFEAHLEYWQEICKSADPIYFICRRGNESQRAVVWVQEKFGVDAFDIVGGLTKWSEVVDITFPSY